MNLKQKTALITGASSGIGKAFAYLLGKEGSHLILVARSLGKLEEIAADIQKKYQVKVVCYQKDLSQPGAAREFYDQLQKDKKPVDLLINNAGFGKWGPLEDFSLQVYNDMVQLNVTALMELCYLLLPEMKQKTEAGIINVGSTASFLPVPYSAVYAATKSFVLNFTEGLVGELADSPVKVCCLCPSGTASNFAEVANGKVDNSNQKLLSSEEVAAKGLQAFLKGKHYVVTGRKTQILITKFLSRRKVINLVAASWKKRLGL